MKTTSFTTLQPHSYINYDGEIITKEKAKELIDSGKKPILHTVSDEHIEAALNDLSQARKEGRQPTDYTAPDPHAKRILYYPLPYCPVCGVNYGVNGLRRRGDNLYCCNTEEHHGSYHGLMEWPHERVELVSNSFEDGGHYSEDVGKVKDVRATFLCNGGHVEIDLRVEWDNGAEECWIDAESFEPYE